MARPHPPKRSRWNGFLGDVKRESSAFKDVLVQASLQKEESNEQFRQFAQISFNAIHNVQRRKPDPSKAVPRLTRPQTRSASRPPPKKSVWEFEDKDANHTRWPVRPITRTSKRILTPVRVQDYGSLPRPSDIVCVYGAQISPDDDVLTVM
jgi:hypothetical protein